MCTAKCRGFISKGLEARINKVREWRNYVAHYVQRMEKKLLREIRVRFKKKGKRERNKKGETLITWISEEASAKMLRKTAEVLREIIERTYMLLKTGKFKVNMLVTFCTVTQYSLCPVMRCFTSLIISSTLCHDL